MIEKNDIKIGMCYFNLYFIDEAMSCPVIKSGIFLGYSLTDRAQEDGESLLFQETDSVSEHGLYFDSLEKRDCKLFSVHESALDTLFDARGLIEELQRPDIHINEGHTLI